MLLIFIPFRFIIAVLTTFWALVNRTMALASRQQLHHVPNTTGSSLMNFQYSNPLFPIERGALAVQNRTDFFRNIWGVPDDLERVLASNNNMQSMDIIGMYKGRELEIPSNQLTAAVLNAQAGWLSESIAPIFPTAEFNFTSKFREVNNIEFTRTAAGGIPNEQTFRTTEWKDTIEKVQLNAPLELDLALDPNYGADQWLMQLGGLAANAMLTIHKTIAYSLLHIAYTNMVVMNVKESKFDLSRLLMKEEEYFGIAALDQTKFLRMVRRFESSIPNLDTVIIPHNSINYIAEQLGESTSMQSQKLITDPTTGQLLWAFAEGPKSVRSVRYGERTINFVEMQQFRVNMDQDEDDGQMEQPLKTSVTVAQIYPPDPDVKLDDTACLREDALDIAIFHQGKRQGDIERVSIKEAYGAAFYYDESSPDGISEYVHRFAEFKTRAVLHDEGLVPWEFNGGNNVVRKGQDLNTETGYDNDHPNMAYVVGKENLNDMRGWRDRFFGLTYIAAEKKHKVPKRIIDFELWAIPNKAIHKAARGVICAAQCGADCDMGLDSLVGETRSLLNDIANEEWDDTYAQALIDANVERMFVNGSLAPARRRATDMYPEGTVDEWRGNRYGALNLPKRTGGMTQVYPPGFDSGPGLQTLAREADNAESEWRDAGRRAKKVVSGWHQISGAVRKYVGPTDTNHAGLTSPWFHQEDETAVLIDHLRPSKGPVFLQVPSDVTNNTVAPSAAEVRRFADDRLTQEVASFRGDAPAPSGPVSDTAAFIAIIDALPGTANGETLIAPRVTASYAEVLEKLIGYVMRNIYDALVRSPNASVNNSYRIAAYNADRLYNVRTGNNADTPSTTAALTEIGNALDDAANADMKVIRANTGQPDDRKIKDIVKSLNAHDDQGIPQLENALNAYYRLSRRVELNAEDAAELDVAIDVIGNVQPNILAPSQAEGRYLRAPLMAGDRLAEYVARSPRGLVRPARRETNYEDFSASLSKEGFAHLSRTYNAEDPMPLTALPYSQVYKQNLSKSGIAATMMGTKSAKKSDIFDEISVKSKALPARSMDIGDFITTSKSGIASSSMQFAAGSTGSQLRGTRGFSAGASDEAQFARFLASEEYFGPAEARMRYASEHCSPMERVIFMAICMAPNKITIHQRLANIGQKLVNVLLMRLSIQHVMSSAIVMKAGYETIRTAVGHSRVMVTTESRGISRINASFFLGTVRTNPNAIQMMPYVFPDSFVGGMNMEFMRDPSQLQNTPNEKGSLIAVLSPISETKYEYPLHVMNLPTYTRPDIHSAPYMRKYSSSEFISFVLGEKRLNNIQGHIENNKKHYGCAFNISLCLHRGPVVYTDSHGNKKYVAGTGPRGAWRMNKPGAELTWSGQTVKFPDHA